MTILTSGSMTVSHQGGDRGPIRLSYEPYFFSERTVFFSHNKSENNTFQHGLSTKRTGPEWSNKGNFVHIK